MGGGGGEVDLSSRNAFVIGGREGKEVGHHGNERFVFLRAHAKVLRRYEHVLSHTHMHIHIHAHARTSTNIETGLERI